MRGSLGDGTAPHVCEQWLSCPGGCQGESRWGRDWVIWPWESRPTQTLPCLALGLIQLVLVRGRQLLFMHVPVTGRQRSCVCLGATGKQGGLACD